MVNTINPGAIHHHHHHYENNFDPHAQQKLDELIEAFGDKALKKLDKHDEKGRYADIQLKVMTGEELSKKEYKTLKEMSTKFPPELIQYAANTGKISQQDADMLLIAGGLFDSGIEGREDIGRSLANFFSLPPHERGFARDVMSESSLRDFEKDIGDVKLKSLKDAHSTPNPDQARLAVFLSTMQPGQHHQIQNITTWNFDSSHNAIAAALGDIPDYTDMSDTQQEAMVNFIMDLGNGWCPVGGPGHGRPHGPVEGPASGLVGGPDHGRPPHNPCHYPGFSEGCHFDHHNMMGPDFLNQFGISEHGKIDLGSLMYQVMADRIETLDSQVRDYADSVDQRNKEIATNTNAMIELRANLPADGSAANLSGLTFTDGDGREASLAAYLGNEGFITGDTNLSALSYNDIDTLITSIGDKNDTLNSEATADMTKLQQHMDKYSQAVSAQTNFESKWNTMMNAIMSNLR